MLKTNQRVLYLSAEFEITHVDYEKQKVTIKNHAKVLKKPDMVVQAAYIRNDNYIQPKGY